MRERADELGGIDRLFQETINSIGEGIIPGVQPTDRGYELAVDAPPALRVAAAFTELAGAI
jgi:hypothetical protein